MRSRAAAHHEPRALMYEMIICIVDHPQSCSCEFVSCSRASAGRREASESAAADADPASPRYAVRSLTAETVTPRGVVRGFGSALI